MQELDPNQIQVPVSNPPLTPAEAAEGRDTVTMYFENQVMLNVDWGTRVLYTKGVHEVPREWSTHWYLTNHGAERFNESVPVHRNAEAASRPRV